MTTAAPAPTTGVRAFGWRFTTPLLLGTALNPVNSSLLATALVGIGVDLRVGPGTTAALISVLYLCSAIAQPTMGKVSTIVGPRRTFVGGLVLLLVAGAVGACAPSFGWLLLSRALIGIGTSTCYPTAMALIRQRADRTASGVPTTVLGNISIAAQLTATFGFPIGGVLVGALGWRSIFAVNLPLALLTLVLAVRGIPRDDVPARGERSSLLAALDLPGIALFAGAVTSLLVFLAHLDRPLWWLGGLFLVLAACLLLWERRAAQPLLDVRMLASNTPLQRTYLRTGLVSLANYAALLGMSQWLEQGHGLGAGTVGLVLLPLSGVAAVASRVVSRRGWVRWPLVVGGGAQGLGGLALVALTHTTSIVLITGTTLLLGCYGLGSVGNQATLYLQSPAEAVAVASGLFRTANYIGAIFSSSLLALAFGPAATDVGLHRLGWVLVVVGVLVAVLAVTDRSVPARAT
ncbi:MAG: MFS transporter [Oryzihumus sp.]